MSAPMPPVPEQPAQSPAPKKSSSLAKALWFAVILMVVVIIIQAAKGGSGTSTPGSSTQSGDTVAQVGSATEQAVCADVTSPDVTGKNLVFAHGGALDSVGPDLDAMARDKTAGVTMILDGASLQLDIIGATKDSVANLDADLNNLRTDCAQQAG